MDDDLSQENRIRLIGRLFFKLGINDHLPCGDIIFLLQLSAQPNKMHS